MSLAGFTFTDRCWPVVEVGIGDARLPTGQARWDVARWDQDEARWAGVEPTWFDITCEVQSIAADFGRLRTTERFTVGTAQVVVDNASGWADPNTARSTTTHLNLRPGRAIRFGMEHVVYGLDWLWRGFIDSMVPTYDPFLEDTVRLECVDALGEVNRVKLAGLPVPQPPEQAGARVTTILDWAQWPEQKRQIAAASTVLLESDLAGQVADLLGVAADSIGGVIYGDTNADIVLRNRNWQSYPAGEPVDGTIGNWPGDVCPVQWERPYDRADITTRVLLSRPGDDVARVYDDDPAQLLFGIEPFERSDLLTRDDAELDRLGHRLLTTRGMNTAPRIRAVTLDASTAPNALDLMCAVDVFQPSRYRCRLQLPRGEVFDAEHYATGAHHTITRDQWTLRLDLDTSEAYAADGARWDRAPGWDRSTWAATTTAVTVGV